MEAKKDIISPGIPDSWFLKSKSGLTREEIRAIVISKARIRGGERVLDVGAGSGSVSIEFARLGCNVTAIEKDRENFEVARRNIENFGLKERVKLILGRMEEISLEDSFDVIFFGGSDNLKEAFENAFKYANRGGRIIIAAVRLETVTEAISLFRLKNIEPEILSICLAEGKKLGNKTAIAPSYPVFLIYGEKED